MVLCVYMKKVNMESIYGEKGNVILENNLLTIFCKYDNYHKDKKKWHSDENNVHIYAPTTLTTQSIQKKNH